MATSCAVAQIVGDNTLPASSVVTPQGNTTVIDGGTVAGSNLFHSFQEFSVFSGGTAFFNNSLNIQNILTRVTGGSASNINGLLQARGNANLFLINPNGIIFGRDAALNIGGSFVASTANSIKFSDGSEYSTINPQSSSSLSINVPLGLQFPGIPTSIINRAANLQVLPEKTIALVGGDITLDRSQLTAERGRIELGSVGANSLVSLNPIATGWSLGYGDIKNFGNIQLLGQSIVSASGVGGGNIQVQGGRVSLTDSSKIFANTSGNQNAGEIFVRATDLIVTNGSEISVETSNQGNAGIVNVQANTVEVSGASSDGQVFSTIAAKSTGSGGSGSINITTNRLTAKDGGDVSVTTSKSGEGGNLTINASELVELIGVRTSPGGQNFSRSGLFAATEGTGQGGNMEIKTPQLIVRDGARVSVSTRGAGQDGKLGGRGGNLSVSAGVIDLSGTSADGRFISGLFALSGEERPNIKKDEATGPGGNIIIDTGRLIIRDGAQVSAATEGIGQGGNITVERADVIEVTGASIISREFSTLGAISRGSGGSGNIRINTRQLRVSNGADVSVSVLNKQGGSGELTVNASELVELTGASAIPNSNIFSRSGLFAATEGTENGGSLKLTTPRLVIKDGARISVSTRGPGEIRDGKTIPGGKGGNLTVNASDSIELSGAGEVAVLGSDGKPLTFTSGLFALSGEARPNIRENEATGGGGDITINTGRLIIRDGAQVSAATAGSGKGGNINVERADVIEVTGASPISRGFSTLTAISRGSGGSGNISINTRQLRVSNGADVSISALNKKGASGELTVTASELVELIGVSAFPNSNIFSRSGLFAATEGTENGGSLTVNTPRLVIKDGARISVSTRGPGENGTLGGKGGNLTVKASDNIELSGIGEVQLLLSNGQIETRRFASGLFALSGEARPTIREDEATGTGGNLEINTGLLNIRDGAEVSVSARGQGAAGGLKIGANSIRLNNGSIIGSTLQGNGANIDLEVQNSLQLRGNSQISTDARSGDGGNITIAADTLAIIDNGRIIANAGRQGGKVQITTQGLFARNPENVITASSDQGIQFNGTITINTPDVTRGQGFVDIPANFFTSEKQVAQACAAEVGENRSRFIITGRGGLPPSPEEPLSSDVVRVTTTPGGSTLNNSNVLVKLPRPATSWGLNSKGEVVLTSNTANFTQSYWLPQVNCYAR